VQRSLHKGDNKCSVDKTWPQPRAQPPRNKATKSDCGGAEVEHTSHTAFGPFCDLRSGDKLFVTLLTFCVGAENTRNLLCTGALYADIWKYMLMAMKIFMACFYFRY